MPRKLTQEIAEQRVSKKCKKMGYKYNPFKYISSHKTTIHLICKHDGYKWDVTYNCFINDKTGCPKCYGNLPLSQEEAEKNVAKRCIEMGYEYEPFIYITSRKTTIHLICKHDGYKWDVKYDDFIHNETNCPKCSGKLPLPQEEAEKFVAKRCIEMGYEYEPFVYINTIKTILHLICKHDGYKWNVTYNNFINNETRCAKCSGNLPPSQEEAEKNVAKRCIEMGYEYEPFVYTNSNNFLYLKCTHDGHEWKPTYNSFISLGSGCPECSRFRYTPKELYSDFELYRKDVAKETYKHKKELFGKWDGYDAYESTHYIKDYPPSDYKNYRSIDHIKSVHQCFMNGVSFKECGALENLCITSRSNNSSKKNKTDWELKTI